MSQYGPQAIRDMNEADRLYTRRWLAAHREFMLTADLLQAMEGFNTALAYAAGAWKQDCREAIERDAMF